MATGIWYLTDLFLYAGKNRPELYFDEGFRNGISSFREYAGAEVPDGLARLRADLDSGRWQAIRAGADQESKGRDTDRRRYFPPCGQMAVRRPAPIEVSRKAARAIQ